MISKIGLRGASALSAVMLGMTPVVALAQNAAAGSETAATPDDPKADDIIVTAQKRSESLQRVAAAASVATGGELAARGINSISGLASIAPSVKLTAIRQQTQIFIRGVGSSLTSSNGDPAVAVNFNGAYLQSEITGSAFFDVERIEVLPGPQGTLYGRNAAGGAINVISKRPTEEFGGEGTAEFGNYGTINLTGAVNLPVHEGVSFRVSGQSLNHNYYVKTLNNGGVYDQDLHAIRGSALITPLDGTTLYTTFSYIHDGGIPVQNQNNPPLKGDYWTYPVDTIPLGLFSNSTAKIVTAEVDQKISDALSFTYIYGHSNLKLDANAVLFIVGPSSVRSSQRIHSNTHEARVAGDYGAFRFVAGGYYYSAYAFNSQSQNARAAQRFINAGPFSQNSHGAAGFGQVTYSIVDPLRLIGGVRYSDDHKDISGVNTTVTYTGVSLLNTPFNGSRSDSRWDYKGGVEFDVASESLLYATVQTGFNQGGFSTAPVTPGSIEAARFEPAKVLAYTAGSKNRFFDRKLRLNFEAFYYDYKNYQVSARNLSTGQNQIFNAAKARSYGAQVDAAVKIGSGSDISLDFAYLNAAAVTLVIPPNNYSGNSLPFSPTWSVNASYRQYVELGGGDGIEGVASLKYVDSLYSNYAHLPGTFQPAYAKVDLNLNYRPAGGQWSIGGYIRNLTDNATFAQLNAGAQPGPGAGYLDPPRTFGTRIEAKF